MPQNKRESLIYTVMMCFCMIVWMSIYNVAIQYNEFSLEIIKKAWVGVPIAYLIGIVLDWFIVSNIVKKVVFTYLLKREDSNKIKVLYISTGMVIWMCLFMSFYGAVEGCMHTHQWNSLFQIWVKCVLRNFIMAWPVQMLIMGPLVRKTFRYCFPVGAISG